jgi:putative flippase GtrA
MTLQGTLSSLPGPARLLGKPVIVQFVKFGIVGISNTLVNFAVYTVLLKVFDVWYLAAAAIGFGLGAVNGFLLNRRWTFEGHVGDAFTPVRWAIVQSCGLALNEVLLYLWVDRVGVDKLIAQALSIMVVTTVTFMANRAWTFRAHAIAQGVPGIDDRVAGQPNPDGVVTSVDQAGSQPSGRSAELPLADRP